MGALRRWQEQAINQYHATNPRDFLTTATPGAGKTTFALTLAQQLHEARVIDRVIVVAPTDHLRTQWAHNATPFGLHLDPKLTNSHGAVRKTMNGYVTTYAQVAANPIVHRRRTETARTLVILDEIHHAGDALSWGEAIREAFTPAVRRLALTGTPFRTKLGETIPFVRYDDNPAPDAEPGELISIADYAYGYANALADQVVRPVVFAAYAGRSRWRNSAGEVLTATLGTGGTKKSEEAAWRTALDPNGRWVPHVLVAANQRITDLRESGIHDAAGLLLAGDQETARAYATVLETVTGEKPVLVLSDDPRSSARIKTFSEQTDPRWIVAVRMVSEGVDIPRICVIAWMTSYRTPLFFAQAVGRAIRARHAKETATVFLPAVRPLLALAADMETERNNIVRFANGTITEGLDTLETPTEPNEPVAEFEALGADAEFAHVLHSGKAFLPGQHTTTLTDDDEAFLGLPGLLDPTQIAALLAERDKTLQHASQQYDRETARAEWEHTETLRQEITKLVRRWVARTGKTHAEAHIAIRKAIPGPASADASADVLTRRRDWLLARVH